MAVDRVHGADEDADKGQEQPASYRRLPRDQPGTEPKGMSRADSRAAAAAANEAARQREAGETSSTESGRRWPTVAEEAGEVRSYNLVHDSICDGIGRKLIDGQAQQHIISGDLTGGGHKWPGMPGKTVFPPSWDTNTIIDRVAEVATNPESTWTWQTGTRGSLYTRAGDPSRVAIQGVSNGVKIKVIYEPASGRVVTGFPLP